MPYICDMSSIDWPADGMPPPPKPSDFQYLKPPQFGGVREPVRFTVPTLPAASPAPAKSSLIDRLLRRTPLPVQPDYRNRELEGENRLLARVVPALRALGATVVHCRYDGGNDEGFAWIDRVELTGGERIDVDELSRRLSGTGLAADMAGDEPGNAYLIEDPMRAMRENLEYGLAVLWVSKLLGEGFGTGEYSMYGAFRVDLVALTIRDDPGAEPVVRNIEIDLGEDHAPEQG
jgi:hypothetical protein